MQQLCLLCLLGAARALAPPVQQLESLAPPAPQLESRVVAAIKGVAAELGTKERDAARSVEALGEFGTATGALVVAKWLTPETVEDVYTFWQDGLKGAARDVTRVNRWRSTDAKAALTFAAIVPFTFPWTPLYLPLIDEALEGTPREAFVPSCFSKTRLGAMRRLAGGADATTPEWSPRNAEESLGFFRDGTALAARDLRRGRGLVSGGDSWVVWTRFIGLAFSTFPLTPLLLPTIDRRRPNGTRSDFVPSHYRSVRLDALARLRRWEAARYGDCVATLRSVATDRRPPTTRVLDAAIDAQRLKQAPADMLDALAGGGDRWQLAYIVDKNAVVARRRERGDSGASWKRSVKRFFLPWSRLDDGVFVDFVRAVQRFDAETLDNENGVYKLFGSDFFQTTVRGSFRWTERGVCGFRPDVATFKVGPFDFKQDLEEPIAFDDVPMKSLPFFKFIHVDNVVAVAQGRSGSVALWTRLPRDL